MHVRPATSHRPCTGDLFSSAISGDKIRISLDPNYEMQSNVARQIRRESLPVRPRIRVYSESERVQVINLFV